MTNKDAFDLWWEWADKPVDNKPTIDAVCAMVSGLARYGRPGVRTCMAFRRRRRSARRRDANRS
jgi:hypothetical protein